jgi:hypothetical protein
MNTPMVLDESTTGTVDYSRVRTYVPWDVQHAGHTHTTWYVFNTGTMSTPHLHILGQKYQAESLSTRPVPLEVSTAAAATRRCGGATHSRNNRCRRAGASAMPKRKQAGVHHQRSATAKRGGRDRSVALEFDHVDSGESGDEDGDAGAAAALAEAEALAAAESEETADEKRLRLAKEFLEKLAKSQAEGGDDDDEFFDRGIVSADADDAVNRQLVADALEKSGKATVELADALWTGDLEPVCRSFRVRNVAG